MTEFYSDFQAAATLVPSISAGATSFDVSSAANLPATGNFRLRIGSEIVKVTGVSGVTLTVVRGQEGTTAATHSAGDGIYPVMSKVSWHIGINRQPFVLPVRLDYSSTVLLTLNAVGCGTVVNPLDDSLRNVTGAIATLGNGGLSASTLYYVYWDVSAGTLSASTTVPLTSDGIDYKTGDTAKLLVGWAYVDASGLFAWDANRNLVVSRYNQRSRRIQKDLNPQTVNADNTWYSLGSGVSPAAEIWSMMSERMADPIISTQCTARHTAGGAHILYGVGFNGSGPDTANDVYCAHKVDSSTERVSLARTVFPARNGATLKGLAEVVRATSHILGESVGSGYSVVAHSGTLGSVNWGPTISAEVWY